MKESDIQKSIVDYLTIKKHFFWRQNSGAFKTERGGFYRAGTSGVPDIIIIQNGCFVGLEVKTPKGKQTDSQKEFERGCTEAGGKYFVVRSIDDVRKLRL